jgi:RNA-directed DNA polymerase
MECKNILMEWLKDMGLELKPSKTRICHTLNDPIINVKTGEITHKGFDFLGFNVRQYPVGKYQSGKINGELLGFKTLIKPSKEAIKRHYQKLCDVIDRHKGQKQEVLIKALNPIIRGWCNYYSTSVTKEVFNELDNLLYWKLMKWGIKRHNNKTKKFVTNKYFHIIGNNNWRFATRMKDGKPYPLISHSETPIVRHTKVKGNASPYDGNSVYWSTRMGRNPDMSKRTATLLKRQKGKCIHCGLTFKYGDIMETDHIKPLKLHGSRGTENLQLLHRHCHDEKTKGDGSLNKIKISGNSLWPIPDNYKWVNDTLILMY